MYILSDMYLEDVPHIHPMISYAIDLDHESYIHMLA